jgi:hypothetical protein
MAVQTEIDNKAVDQKPIVNKKKKLQWMRDKDREMVKGMFKFYEVEGGMMSFVYRAYKQDKTERYDLVDGHIYTIPLGVAKHLNKNGWYPIHGYIMDEKGTPSMKIGQKKRRFGFQSLEFVDIEELGDAKDIVTVEKA